MRIVCGSGVTGPMLVDIGMIRMRNVVNGLFIFLQKFACITLAFLVLASSNELADAGTKFHNPAEAFRQGLADYQKQNIEHAIPALKFAARNGVRQADLFLARIYMTGLGVEPSRIKAFKYYQNYAYNYSKISFRHAYAANAAEAFVALGKLYQSGISGSSVRIDQRAAFRHFYHAATQFRDPVAQYYVARIYLSGEGRSRNARMAANWLKRGYQKNHAASQARLGDLFWRGEGVEKNRLIALALLKIANINAFDRSCPGYDPETQRWISKLLKKFDSTTERVFREKAEDAARALYQSCGKEPTLESIEGFFIRHNIIVRRNKKQPIENLVTQSADSPAKKVTMESTMDSGVELGFEANTSKTGGVLDATLN